MSNELVIHDLLRDLCEGDVVVSTKLYRGLRGAFDADITLKTSKNLSQDEQLVTIIHEYLHYLDSSTPEEVVEMRAYEIFALLTDEQYGLLYFFLSEALQQEHPQPTKGTQSSASSP